MRKQASKQERKKERKKERNHKVNAVLTAKLKLIHSITASCLVHQYYCAHLLL